MARDKTGYILFTEMKNSLLRALLDIINEIAAGARYTIADIDKALDEARPEWKEISAAEKKALWDAFFICKDNAVVSSKLPYAKKALILPPGEPERRWLKTMLLDANASFLLSPALREKLLRRLDAYPNDIRVLPGTDIWNDPRTQNSTAADNARDERMRTLRDAFLLRKKIFYRNRTKNGAVYEGTVSPCRMEYDLARGRFALVIWSDEEERAVKMSLSTLETLRIVDAPIPADIETRFRAFLEKKISRIRLRLKNIHNVVERAFLLFASYDKEAYIERGEYYLTVSYYEFDAYEIFDKVLSLGAGATILDPPEMRRRMIDILRGAAARYLSPGEERGEPRCHDEG